MNDARDAATGIPLLLFLHIPKTAGTTLTDIICRQYAACIRCTDTFFLEDHADEIEHANALCGHFLFGLHKHFLPRPCTYITMMRDPVEQLISWFYFRYRSESFEPYPGTFEDYLEDGDVAAEFNLQTRFLAGGSPDVALAEYNLTHHFAFVGVTELFDESLYLLQQQLRWRDVEYKREYVNPNRPSRADLGSAIITRIEEKNDLDVRLYEVARSRLERQLNSLNGKAKRKIYKLKQASH